MYCICPWQNVFNHFIVGQERRKIKNREGKSQFQSTGIAAVGLHISFAYWAAVKSPMSPVVLRVLLMVQPRISFLLTLTVGQIQW